MTSLVSVLTDIPMLLVRKQAKSHGLGKQIEGDFSVGDRVILLEDVVTTGGSVRDMVSILQESGLRVEHVFSISNRSPKPLTWDSDDSRMIDSLLYLDRKTPTLWEHIKLKSRSKSKTEVVGGSICHD